MLKIILLTGFALVAFAFNSILCRLALGMNLMDAAGFTAVRLISGAIVLLIIFSVFGKREAETKPGNWLSAFFLFAYAICFSFAYNYLTTGMGALILFGCVQATMILSALVKGERPRILEWFGLLAALGGLVYLVLPGLSAPPLFGSFLMAVAGIAWGFYTLRGKTGANPLAETTGNFIRAVPMIVFAAVPFLPANSLHETRNFIRCSLRRDRFGHRLCRLVCRAQISHRDPRRDSPAFRSRSRGDRRRSAFVGKRFFASDAFRRADPRRNRSGDSGKKY